MNIPGVQVDPNLFLRQTPQTVKGSGISLPHEVRQEMARKLDELNCALHVSLHQYNKRHWLTEGAESFLSPHHLLDEHVEKTSNHIDKIGERIARPGGIPTAHPEAQHAASYIKHEAEGRYTQRDMLRNDLEREYKLQEKMREQIARATELRDFGTVEVLEEAVLDREDLAYHLYSVLEDDTLVRGISRILDMDPKERKIDNENKLH